MRKEVPPRKSLPAPRKTFSCERQSVNAVLEHWAFTIFTTVLAVYSMISDDVRQLACSKETDQVVWMMTVVVMAVFTAELVASSLVKPDYFLGFFFWLDIISILSMLLDVGWVSNLIFPTGRVGGLTNASLVRAARASQIGARAGRIVRILRIVRLIRIIKIYKVSDRQSFQDKLIKKKKHVEKDRLFDSQRFSEGEQSLQLRSQVSPGVSGGAWEPSEHPERHPSKQEKLVKSRWGIGEGKHLSASTFMPPVLDERGRQEGGRTRTKSVFFKTIEAEQQKLAEATSQGSLFGRKAQLGSLGMGEARWKGEIEYSMLQLPITGSLQGSLRSFSEREKPKEEEEHGQEAAEEVLDQSAFLGVSGEREEAELKNQIAMVERQLLQETNVGRKLSDATTKRVVVIVLVLMVCIPLFSVDTYAPDYEFYEFGVSQMYASMVYHNGVTPEFGSIWDHYISDSRNYFDPIVSLDIFNSSADENSTISIMSYGNQTDVDSFRTDDIRTFSEPVGDTPASNFTIIMNQDISNFNARSSILSIVRTVFVCLVLAGASLIFAQDATELVLEPVESMLEKINNITQNPLQAAQDEEEQAYLMTKLSRKKLSEEDLNETGILLRIIVKIGRLLAVGFGEAGSEIIIKNLSNRGAINAMIPGTRVLAVFGFCDIRNFTDATEVLKEKVMVFVNEIAQIVHSKTNQFGGAANKNIGDAFLLVWKISGEEADELAHFSDEMLEVELKKLNRAKVAAELALYAFVKILAEINQSQVLAKYHSHEGLRKRIKNFRVRMGFGLHLGWAIEGAIGSDYKIDASYLSPHVNMASRLEAATKQFEVSILVSETIAKACSDDMRRNLRQIDKVTVKGSTQPVGLFTFDGDFERLPVKLQTRSKADSEVDKKRKKFIERSIRKNLLDLLLTEKQSVANLLRHNQVIQLARLKYTQKFYQLWDTGFQSYLSGDWPQAARFIAEASNEIGGDGPARVLLDLMGLRNNKAPQDWKGFRELKEK